MERPGKLKAMSVVAVWIIHIFTYGTKCFSMSELEQKIVEFGADTDAVLYSVGTYSRKFRNLKSDYTGIIHKSQFYKIVDVSYKYPKSDENHYEITCENSVPISGTDKGMFLITRYKEKKNG